MNFSDYMGWEKHPYEQLMYRHSLANNAIALPPNLFAPLRKNSQGVSLDIASEQMPLMAEVALYSKGQWQANSIIDGKKALSTHPINVTSPFDNKVIVGERYDATPQEIESASMKLEKRLIFVVIMLFKLKHYFMNRNQRTII